MKYIKFIYIFLIISILISGCQVQSSCPPPPAAISPPTTIHEKPPTAIVILEKPSTVTVEKKEEDEAVTTYSISEYVEETESTEHIEDDNSTSTAVKLTGKVVKVSDGDTIHIHTPKGKVKIRFTNIDCPESDQPYGSEATQFVYDMVMDKTVTAVADPDDLYDRYGRFLGNIIMEDGKSLNEELVAAGLAWHYKYYSDDPVLAELEVKAQEKKLGLWADENPIPPWEWRKIH